MTELPEIVAFPLTTESVTGRPLLAVAASVKATPGTTLAGGELRVTV